MSEANATATTQVVADEPVLVGLDDQLGLLSETLEDGQPLLVVIVGGPGSGKSSLLQALRAQADAAGWNTAPAAASETFRVTTETTEETFSTQVQTLMAVPSGQSFVEQSPGNSVVGTSSGQQPLLPILKQLRARVPLLLLVDSFQATPEFADWFQNHFLRDVKRSGAPIIIAVAERPEAATRLSPLADLVVTLGTLDEQAIQQHFEMMGKQISPLMGEDELKVYVAAAYKEPEMLSSLTRALRLAAVEQNAINERSA